MGQTASRSKRLTRVFPSTTFASLGRLAEAHRQPHIGRSQSAASLRATCNLRDTGIENKRTSKSTISTPNRGDGNGSVMFDQLALLSTPRFTGIRHKQMPKRTCAFKSQTHTMTKLKICNLGGSGDECENALFSAGMVCRNSNMLGERRKMLCKTFLQEGMSTNDVPRQDHFQTSFSIPETRRSQLALIFYC